MKVNFEGIEWQLPYHGRLGISIQKTLHNIVASSEGIALYAAQDLHGEAKRYESRYRAAFIRFAEANDDKLVAGNVGPHGGFGYRFQED